MKKILFSTFFVCILLLSGCSGLMDAEISINTNLKIYKTNPQTYSVNYANGGQFLIEPTISEVNWNHSYLVAKRKHEGKFDYWIIELENEEIYGPLSEIGYSNMKKDLNIDIELKPIDDFF